LINTRNFGTPTARTMIGNNKSKIGIKGGARAGEGEGEGQGEHQFIHICGCIP